MKKMDFSGLSDSPMGIAKECALCRCGSLARIGSGLCVSCLLRTALGGDGPDVEDFEGLLASVNVPDRDWQLGNYRILEEVGRGGMGVIYRARHAPSRRIVALKRVLNYHNDSQETLTRFQREARAAASLDHPNILPIYDLGATEDGLPFFSMKFAAGGSLLDSKQNFRGMPQLAAKLISKVARAVDYAHSRGILHRDLKPGNILLDARGEPMVSDFGLAKWLDTASELTRTLTVFGTPGYIAPEQSENASTELTAATDVYSLGAILFELLSGRPPFLGEHALAVLRQAAENDAPKLRAIVPKASRDLETICARCLERDPNLRYATAATLAEDLDRWLEGRPIAARPISPPMRLYRWARRNPVLATSIGICLCFAALVATRQVQSCTLENRIRESELAKNSVAVLPFLDLDSATYESDWTAEVTRSLQADISMIGNARVIPSGNVADIKTAARRVGTRTVLFGTRRKTERGIQVSVQLSDPDGQLLFGRIVDLKTASDFDSFARELAPKIHSILTANDWSNLVASKRDPGLQNQKARELITAGRELHFRYTLLDFDRAISCFQKALNLEPQSALAHAYLSISAAGRVHLVSDSRFLDRADTEAREALRLAPSLADGHRALAGVLYQRGRLRESLEEQMRALELAGPEERVMGFIAMTLSTLGQPNRALPWYELTRRWAIRPGNWDSLIGDCWSKLGNDEKAEKAYRRATDLQSDMPQGWVGIARLRLFHGETEAARRICRELQRQYGESIYSEQMAAIIEFFTRNYPEAERLYNKLAQADSDGGASFYGNVGSKSALGYLVIASGDSRRGRTLLGNALAKELAALTGAPDNPEVLYRLAAIESCLGKTESAITHLEAAVAAGWIDYRSLSLDPRFDAIANDIRFQTLLGRLKIKTEELRRSTVTDV
jgi:serine/threonine protein kinase/tetratricopeptide (TPR) repeat protein